MEELNPAQPFCFESAYQKNITALEARVNQTIDLRIAEIEKEIIDLTADQPKMKGLGLDKTQIIKTKESIKQKFLDRKEEEGGDSLVYTEAERAELRRQLQEQKEKMNEEITYHTRIADKISKIN